MRIPKLVEHSTARRIVDAVQPHCEVAVQMAHEIAMGSGCIFEACDQMIMICEERPSLKDECIISCQFQSCVTKNVQLGLGIEESFPMKRRRGDYIRAVGREIMGWRMRPTLAHAIPYHISRGGGDILLVVSQKSDARTRRTPKALRARSSNKALFDTRSVAPFLRKLDENLPFHSCVHTGVVRRSPIS